MDVTKHLYTGDILHCSTDRLLGKLIKWFTKSEVSHTAVVVECWGQIYVVDAQHNGVAPRPLEAWKEEFGYDVIVARPNIGPRDPHTFSIRAFTKVGHTGYDFGSLLWRHPWAIMTGRWAKDKDPNDKRMVCSEYVAWLYHIEKPYRVTPKKMYDYTQRHDFSHYKLEY